MQLELRAYAGGLASCNRIRFDRRHSTYHPHFITWAQNQKPDEYLS